MIDKKIKMFVSVSGGETSMRMVIILKHHYSHMFDFQFVFSNTGQEDEQTLIFLYHCAMYFDLPVTWVEAVVHHGERSGCSHRVVDYATASRNGEPFEEMIKKYGIPNKAYPHCTRELKMNPMYSYIKSIGWNNDYLVAIGIRVDEPKRLGNKTRIVYPLAHWFPMDKQDVNTSWEDEPFRLNIAPHRGNCKWCWKKSLNKHFMLMDDEPEMFDFPQSMEELHGLSGHNTDGNPRVFFRGNMSTVMLREMHREMGRGARSASGYDEDQGCSESCEAFIGDDPQP